MTTQSPSLSLTARWVIPIAGPPISGGVVTIEGERIATVGTRSLADNPTDLGDVAILPGLVNAHTHLEFSELTAPLGTRGVSLPEWIPQVIAHRRAAGATTRSAIASGLAESIACGTTSIGDITTSDWPRDVETPVAVTAFREWIAPSQARVAAALQAAEAALLTARALSNPSVGISPHAPYTVHPELLAGLAQLSRHFDMPLAMHLAESREELELIENGTGPFREMLSSLGAWDSAHDARLKTMRGYLEQLTSAPRALVVHGNYLNQQETEFLAERRERMSVVYCPRTHDYFGHTPYPLAERLATGVAMALGTDSRASNPDLSVLAEMQFVAVAHPRIEPLSVLELGTLAGARALGRSDQMGSLEPGKLANLCVVGPLESRNGDAAELVLAPETHVLQTWIRGRLVHDADGAQQRPTTSGSS